MVTHKVPLREAAHLYASVLTKLLSRKSCAELQPHLVCVFHRRLTELVVVVL